MLNHQKAQKLKDLLNKSFNQTLVDKKKVPSNIFKNSKIK